MTEGLHGLLLVDKPPGMTSFDVVRRVRALSGQRKVGHTGTLDPFATGVLPLCLGSATRLAGWLSASDKVYEATLVLGVTTDTLDRDGEVIARRPVSPDIQPSTVLDVFSRFTGTIEQIPPMYSALKVGGKRLHRYAREGVTVARRPRQVVVHRIELLGIEPPEITFRVRCSKGTYVRVLAADIGEALGYGAHLAALRRTRSGRFDVRDALTLEVLRDLADAGTLSRYLVPPRDMIPELPLIEVDRAAADRVVHGNPIVWRRPGGVALRAGDQVRVCLGPHLLAVGEVTQAAPRGPSHRVVIQPRTVLRKN